MGEVVKHGLFGVLHRSPARALHVSCRPACSRTAARAVVALHVAGILLTVILALSVHLNLSASAPRGLYRTVTVEPTRGAWVVACVSPQSAALARARGYLGPGRCAGGTQPMLKPIVAVAGDVVEIGPEAVTVNGQRLPGSLTAASDSLGRATAVAWG